ncbi:MAG: acyl-CoA dehydrogenase, partial [Actinobacteria bacterium]|nr:acyl-CoA dehydrogenase [Actinomycetota bacterium]
MTSVEIPAADLTAAADALELAQGVLDDGIGSLAAVGLDDNQVLAYDIAHAAAAVMASRGLLSYGSRGKAEAAITCAFAAEAISDLAAKVFGREDEWGVAPDALDGARSFVA